MKALLAFAILAAVVLLIGIVVALEHQPQKLELHGETR